MLFQKPRGTQDILPQDSVRWRKVERIIHDLCRTYAFEEIRTPIFEQTSLFQRGVGETTDIVEKEMYTFQDKSKELMTLRPEGTAGIVRAYVEHKLYGNVDATKLYYVGPMFRYERPQAGRQRQFHQFGVEAFGSMQPSIDVEVMSLAMSFCEKVGLSDVTLEINSLGTTENRQEYREALIEFLQPMAETLCSDCQARITKNPLRVLDCKVDQEKFDQAPSILEFLDDESRNHFESVQKYLTDMKLPYRVNPRLVRGLDYYTQTTFELKAKGIGAIDTIGGGGRYHRLVQEFGGPEQPGIGFGIGLERILLLMEQNEVCENLDAYFIIFDEAGEQVSSKLLYEARQAGLSAERDYLGKKVKAQFKAAVRNQAQYLVMLGEEELKNGQVGIKNTQTQEQQLVALEHMIDTLKRGKNKC